MISYNLSKVDKKSESFAAYSKQYFKSTVSLIDIHECI